MPRGLIIFDCDSTLSSLEGIDELARFRGVEVFEAIESMTRDAMDGKISVESIFARRLEIIQPRMNEFLELGGRYIGTAEAAAKDTVALLKQQGWTPAIVSAGFLPAVLPFAEWLGIAEVHAVPVEFHPDGSYKGFDATFPPTRSGGKPLVVRQLKERLQPGRTVMVGDGVSDLETLPEVDLFVGFGGFVVRPAVKEKAPAWITKFSELPGLLRVQS